jgi:hypothetical protein
VRRKKDLKEMMFCSRGACVSWSACQFRTPVSELGQRFGDKAERLATTDDASKQPFSAFREG